MNSVHWNGTFVWGLHNAGTEVLRLPLVQNAVDSYYHDRVN